jgi:hypothetical protein
MSGPPALSPSGSRGLAVAIRFVDGFTGQPVNSPLLVSINTFTGIDPSVMASLSVAGWNALWSETDSTYRFSVPNVSQVPTGIFDLAIANTSGVDLYSDPPAALPNGPYAAQTQLQVTIPPVAAHPPPVLATDYLVQLELWPTVAFTVPYGETAVSGWVVSADGTKVAGLKVNLSASATGANGEPWVSTDGSGQFLYRLPNLPRPAGPDPQVTLDVAVVDQTASPLTVTPTSLTVPAGKLTGSVRLRVP